MPRSEKRNGVLLLGWMLLVALPAQAAERALTLDEALRLALERNPEVRAVEAEVGAARGVLRAEAGAAPRGRTSRA